VKLPSRLKSGSLDVLTGLLGLVLLLILDFRTFIKFDLRWFFAVGAASCCALGFARSQTVPKRPWVQAALISCGFGLPLLLLSMAGMGMPAAILIAFLIVSTSSILCGVLARQNWKGGHRVTAVLFLLVPVGCVVTASISVLPRVMASLSGEHVDLPAPEFSLTTEDGTVLTSANLRGKVVILAFWATWCEPCWRELPRVANVYATYRSNRLVSFWAVNAQAGGDTVETARTYARKMHLEVPVAYTENANAVRLGVNGYPALILLDANGRLRFIHDGYDASEQLEPNLTHEIRNLLNQQ